ncbi:hypothetical protein WMF20_01130 [Sorangium sp. So ce834]|uniref:hypothetical protein n=1 Tax=Sorangium sp. So ce834 TaxID=3133321 RepID=UPI00101A4951
MVDSEATSPVYSEATPPVYNEDGVDLTLIRWMLSLTPADRVATLQAHIDFVTLARESRRAREPHVRADEAR